MDPVKPERGGVNRRGAIVGLLMVGLILGGIVGGWIGGIVGTDQSDVAEVAGECYLEGCAFMVVGYVFFGIILGAILGAILGGLAGVWLNSRRAQPPASMRSTPEARRRAGAAGG